jgi:conjugal transfer pilus assembly protein TraF
MAVARLALTVALVAWAFAGAAAQQRPGAPGAAPPASGATGEERWLRGGREGWFFYQERVDPEDEPRPRPRPPQTAPPPATSPPPLPPIAAPPQRSEVPPAAPPAGPVPLSAAWFRQNMESFRDRALDDPTPANVQAFLILQRIMLDKAQRFTDATQEAVAANPDLDANAERPLASFAASRVDQVAAQAEAGLLAHLAQGVGLLFFFRADCQACETQAPVVEMLARAHGFNVLPVSLDGRALPSGLFPRFSVDAGQAATLGVQRTPALFLMRPPGDVVPLSQGVLALAELRSRVLLQARTAGWVSEEAWQATRPVASRSLAHLSRVLDPATLADPAALVAAVRQHLGGNP